MYTVFNFIPYWIFNGRIIIFHVKYHTIKLKKTCSDEALSLLGAPAFDRKYKTLCYGSTKTFLKTQHTLKVSDMIIIASKHIFLNQNYGYLGETPGGSLLAQRA